MAADQPGLLATGAFKKPATLNRRFGNFHNSIVPEQMSMPSKVLVSKPEAKAVDMCSHLMTEIYFDSIHLDPRCSLMIRNIPNSISRNELQEILDADFEGLYDYLYLPIDFSVRRANARTPATSATLS